MKSSSRILVIKLGPLGDFVLSLSAMKHIRDAHRDSHITLLTTPQFESLARACPYFDQVEPHGEPDGMGDTLALIGWMRRTRFDRIYDLTGNKRTNTYFQALKPFPPAWSGPAPGARFQTRVAGRERTHLLEREAEQLRAAGIWPDAPVERGMAPPPDLSWILKKAPEARPVAGQGAPRPVALLAPGGTSDPAKLWPIENYAALAAQLRERGFDVVVVGTPEESAMARAIQRLVPHARDLTGRTDLAQIAVWGARARLAVGNDSGSLHLMAAAGAPTIALFSASSDPDVTGPRGYVAILSATPLRDLPVAQVAQAAATLAPNA
jgi:ADP-heptose:LPS heptosyltransferase